MLSGMKALTIGSGKSSLVALACGLLKLQSGSIFLDDIDMATLPSEVIRHFVTALPQEPLILEGTVRFNIFANEGVSDFEIMDALTAVGLWDMVKKHGGLDAEICDLHLSSGQQQLLRLGCAMLKRTRILILDEPTSSIDDDTERSLQQFIQREFRDLTIITVAHRINTILHCDRVVVMDSGHLVECGNPDELLGSDSLFAALHRSQL